MTVGADGTLFVAERGASRVVNDQDVVTMIDFACTTHTCLARIDSPLGTALGASLVGHWVGIAGEARQQSIN